MRELGIAEWLLSLVLPADRAASVVGDFAEEADERGLVWFWLCVLRTVGSRVWSDLVESPFYLGGVVLRGYFLSGLGTLCCFVGFAVAMAPIFIATAWLEHEKVLTTSFAKEAVEFLTAVIGTAAMAVAAFQTGRWIAQRAPRREMTACVMMCAAWPLMFNYPSIGYWFPGNLIVCLSLVYVSLFAGAWRVRRGAAC